MIRTLNALIGRFLCYRVDQRLRISGETRADGVDTSVDICPGRIFYFVFFDSVHIYLVGRKPMKCVVAKKRDVV